MTSEEEHHEQYVKNLEDKVDSNEQEIEDLTAEVKRLKEDDYWKKSAQEWQVLFEGELKRRGYSSLQHYQSYQSPNRINVETLTKENQQLKDQIENMEHESREEGCRGE